jgi:hypothetical protein
MTLSLPNSQSTKFKIYRNRCLTQYTLNSYARHRNVLVIFYKKPEQMINMQIFCHLKICV